VRDYRKLAEQLTKEHSLPPDWVTSTLIRRMKAIMSTCFQSVRHKLSHRVGFFDLLGFDFMLDSQLNVRATSEVLPKDPPIGHLVLLIH
jgi:hypothetical protein